MILGSVLQIPNILSNNTGADVMLVGQYSLFLPRDWLSISGSLGPENKQYQVEPAQQSASTQCSATILSTYYRPIPPWNNGKEVPRLDLTSLTTPGQQIHKFDHTRTANLCDWLPCCRAVLLLVGYQLKSMAGLERKKTSIANFPLRNIPLFPETPSKHMFKCM